MDICFYCHYAVVLYEITTLVGNSIIHTQYSNSNEEQFEPSLRSYLEDASIVLTAL